MTLEEYDKKISEATDKAIAAFKKAKEEYERETIELATQAMEANLPKHLAIASLTNSASRIEKELGGSNG